MSEIEIPAWDGFSNWQDWFSPHPLSLSVKTHEKMLATHWHNWFPTVPQLLTSSELVQMSFFYLLLLHLFLFHSVKSWAATLWAFAHQTLSVIEALICHSLAVFLQHKTVMFFGSCSFSPLAICLCLYSAFRHIVRPKDVVHETASLHFDICPAIHGCNILVDRAASSVSQGPK